MDGWHGKAKSFGPSPLDHNNLAQAQPGLTLLCRCSAGFPRDQSSSIGLGRANIQAGPIRARMKAAIPELQTRRNCPRDNWRAIGLLLVVIALSACAVTTQAPPTSTATPPTVTTPADEMRPLTPSEKAALAKTLSQTLKDPNAPQFKWLPVAASGNGPIGYCGLVNIKNSYGRYVGFHRFFAMISKALRQRAAATSRSSPDTTSCRSSPA